MKVLARVGSFLVIRVRVYATESEIDGLVGVGLTGVTLI